MDKTSMICFVCLFTVIKEVFSRREENLQSPCNLAEEGKAYDVHFASTLPENSIRSIQVESHLGIITDCLNGTRSCTTKRPDLYNTTMTQSNGKVGVNLRIYKASRKRLRTDNILYFRAIFDDANTRQKLTCRLNIFCRADPIVPDRFVTQNWAHVTFSTKRIYPPGKCTFSIYFNKLEINLTQPSVANTSLPGDPPYFTSTCSISVPKSSLRSGIYDVHVTMYPDINNNTEDIQYGTVFNYTFNLSSPRLTVLSAKETHRVIRTDINSSVSIVLDIDSDPKPTLYTMIKNGHEAVRFENVTKGGVETHGYTIHLADDAGQTNTQVNVSITISGQNDFNSYGFIIDNGVTPTLYYSFFITQDNGVIPAVNHSFIITHGETNKRLTISILSINFSVIFSIVLLALIGLYLQNTGKIKRRKRKTSFPQEFRDGDVYEEVNSFDEVDYNEMNLDNDRRMKSDNGRVDVTVKHDVLEDASQGKDGNHLGNVYNRVIVQDTPWDILGVTFEGSYNRVGQRGTEQDGGSKAFQETVHDDCTAVADDTTKTSNEYVVMKKPVRNHFEYITVQDLLTKYKRDV